MFILMGDEISIIELLFISKIVPSKSEARRLMSQNGVSVNNEVVNINFKILKKELKNGIIIRKGKKNFFKVFKI